MLEKGDVPLSHIVDQDNRTEWITDKLNLAKTQFMDGINIDIEQAVDEGSPEHHALTSLVKETTEIFHREIPGSQVKWNDWAFKDTSQICLLLKACHFTKLSKWMKLCQHFPICPVWMILKHHLIDVYLSPISQVSFDVAWSPKCIDKRCYDYVTIAESCDLLFVMSYDEQSQITGDCIAMANAPLRQTLDGQWSSLVMNRRKASCCCKSA